MFGGKDIDIRFVAAITKSICLTNVVGPSNRDRLRHTSNQTKPCETMQYQIRVRGSDRWVGSVLCESLVALTQADFLMEECHRS